MPEPVLSLPMTSKPLYMCLNVLTYIGNKCVIFLAYKFSTDSLQIWKFEKSDSELGLKEELF